jgi:hypothetical protein
MEAILDPLKMSLKRPVVIQIFNLLFSRKGKKVKLSL